MRDPREKCDLTKQD